MMHAERDQPREPAPTTGWERATESLPTRAVKAAKRTIKHLLVALGKRNKWFQSAYRSTLKRRRVRAFQEMVSAARVDDRTVVLECFRGRTYGCSPKALYEEMLSDPRFDDFTFVWAFKRPEEYAGHPKLGRAVPVVYGSREFHLRLAGARYWILNSRLPEHVDPAPGHVYVQAWHGTPLKRIGCDLSDKTNALYSDDEIFRQYDHDGQHVDLFVSPSPFATQKFITAFNLDGRGRESAVLESGYPRNDALARCTPDDTVAARERLGLPLGKKIVLYAPTWRDDQHKSGVGFVYDVAADFDSLRERLGEEYLILFRAHYIVANEFDFERHGGFVRDVSGVDDINDLYIASDMLVTDYSSVFFDYANLNRPIVFYMYDLEHYEGDVRGFYLDLSELPGPIVQTEPELARAITAAATSDPATDEKYRRFRERFTPLDDGQASRRVLDRMLELGQQKGIRS